MWLGIDFGTCYSCAAYVDEDGKIMLVRDTDNPGNYANSIPSTAFVAKNGEILVGHPANEKMRLYPTRYFAEIKRDLGGGFPLYYDEGELMPETIVTAIIARLKNMAEEAAARSFTAAVVTIPATYQKNKKEIMKKAVLAAGFSYVELLEEPVAAAIYSLDKKNGSDNEETILLYDLGGGTFDAALVKKDEYGYRFLGEPVGNSRCGGLDFDEKLYSYFLTQCSDEFQNELKNPNANSHNMARKIRNVKKTIQDYCCQFKHRLSQMEEWNSLAPDAVLDELEEFSITRRDFEKMIAPLVDDTLCKCQQLIKESKIKSSQITRIVLAGGSSRIPYVKKRLEEYFKRPVDLSRDPELAICQGAAIYGHMRKQMMAAPIVDSHGYYGTYKFIADAVADANEGAVIHIRPGRYSESLVINKNLELVAEKNQQATIIGGDLEYAVFVDGATAALRGISFDIKAPKNSNRVPVGVILRRGLLKLENVDISCINGHGVQLLANAAQGLEIRHSVIHDSRTGLYVEGNEDPNDCTVFIENTQIVNCHELGILLIACMFISNKLTVIQPNNKNSTGILCRKKVDGIIDNSLVEGNLDGIYLEQGRLTLSKTMLKNNQRVGIAIGQEGKGCIKDSILCQNNVGMRCEGYIECMNSEIIDGKKGGIIIEEGASGVLTAVKVSNNKEDGIAAKGRTALQLAGCKIEKNYKGLTLIDHASLKACKCDFFDNESYGISAAASGALSVKECQFTNNQTNVQLLSGSNILLENCKISRGVCGIHFTERSQGAVRGSQIEDCKVGLILDLKAKGNAENLAFKNNEKGILSNQGQGMVDNCQIDTSVGAGIESWNLCKTEFTQCKIQNSSGTGLLIHDSAQSIFKKCEVIGSKEANICIKEKAYPQFIDCEIKKGQSSGVQISDNGLGTFSGCKIYDNSKSNYANAEVAILSDANPSFKDTVITASCAKIAVHVTEGQGQFTACNISASGSACQLISIGSVPNFGFPQFEQCTMSKGYNGIVLEKGSKAMFTECVITKNSNDGIHFNEGACNSIFKSCKIQDNSGDGVYACGSGSAQFKSCLVSGQQGIFSRDWKCDLQKFLISLNE